MNSNVLKFAAAAALFALWTGLIAFRIPNAGDLIEAIKAALLGLGVFHAAMTQPTPAPPPNPQPPAQPAPTTKENLP